MGGHPPPIPTPLSDNVIQLDGNTSVNSSINENENENLSNSIPIFTGHRPTKSMCERPPSSRKVIRRSNKAIQALTLPKVVNYNMRSFFPKIENFSLDMRERAVNLAFLTEIWEKKEHKKHQIKLENMLEMEGISYISTPRPGPQRGGGAAVAVRNKNFTITKLNIQIPKSVEVVWGLLKPKVISGRISVIIVCCFYSPPRSRKNPTLLEHITNTLQALLINYPGAGIIISGDRNSIEMGKLLQIHPSLKQTVNSATRDYRILDVILTNLDSFYGVPEIVPAISPDVPGSGVPSDHRGVVYTPHTNTTNPPRAQRVKKVIRPIPDSLLIEFGEKLTNEDFSSVFIQPTSTQMVSKYQDIMEKMVAETFPLKTITISLEDKPWFNEELRAIKRKRLREYNRHGKSEKYIKLQSQFDKKFQNELQKYKLKIEIEVLEGKRGSSYSIIKKIGLRPGELPQPSFQLPSHVKNNYTAVETAEILAEYFSSVSQEYAPLIVSNLPPNLQACLNAAFPTDLIPTLSVYDVYRKICSAKKPNSSVPGELPRKVIRRYATLLAEPSSVIFNKITHTSKYPDQWKTEHQVPIPKSFPPNSEDDIRNISKTHFLSKVYESFIAGWLLPIIEPYLDPGQCGGLKGLSVSHYLIKLLDFVHINWDKRQPYAVLATCVDLSRAFNRVDHSLVVQDLFDMHTPSWLLKVIISYLSNRSMILTYNGEASKRKLLPGGGPQGAHLGGLIFIVKYNGAFLRPPVPRNIFGPIKTSQAMAVKFIDDGSVAVNINLKTCLAPDPAQRPAPLNYHERTCSVLPTDNNLLQCYLDDAERFTVNNKMKINPEKKKIISFNKSKKFDFPPELKLSDGKILKVVA